MILIKTKKEIDYIRKANQIVGETLQLCKSYAKVGVTTLELDKIAEDYIRSNNGIPAFKGYSQAGSFDFPGTLCTSVDHEVVHGIPNDTPLKEGSILSIDCGVKLEGYFGDAALSVGIGEISEEKQRLMDITEKSLYIGIEQAVVNNRIGDISYSVQQFVEENGYSIVRDLCGHGCGRFLHEEPQIPNFGKKGSGPKIKNGMTLAIEPMVNYGKFKVGVARDGWTIFTADHKPSAHFEHSIAIIDGKPEILSKVN